MKIRLRNPITIEEPSRLIVDYVNVKKPSRLASLKKDVASKVAAGLEKAARKLRNE